MLTGKQTLLKTSLALLSGVALVAAPLATSAEPLPRALAGSWRITRVLPTTNMTCMDRQQALPQVALPLVGSTLTYRAGSLHWRGGSVHVDEITTRDVSADQFRKENPGQKTPATFAQLGIRANTVTEVDFQHEDADVIPATTEIPGDSVLMAGPNRIVVSACGVYFEATRGGGVTRMVLKTQ